MIGESKIKVLRPVGCLALCLATATACAGVHDTENVATDAPQSQQTGPMTDMWIDTRLETAYLFNSHLNNFTIQTDVDDGAVLLTGTVASDIDKDLAGEIARSLNGVRSVNNQLVVKKSAGSTRRSDEAADFVDKVDDATTTARVKTRLIANEHLAGLKIDVDTKDSVVTLLGNVASDQERQLAGLIARNTPDVQSVNNDLEVAAAQSG